MKRTPLFEGHIAKGAKLVDFAGWEMPIHYSGVIDEYHTVRKTAGLFDVSHMGRFSIRGDSALVYLQHVTTNNVARLDPLQSQYSMICNPQGGIKDDIFVYRVKPDEYLLCVNASNREKVLAWLKEQGRGRTGVDISDHSDEIAQLALQGPASLTILNQFGPSNLSLLKPRHCLNVSLLGSNTLITRTGYTGELGYELYTPAENALPIWNALLGEGEKSGLKPVGLGARDLLRLEMAYLLYGNDIGEDTTPLEAAADWVVSFQKGDFIGREALTRKQKEGVPRRLAAFELVEKAVPRNGFAVVNSRSNSMAIGEVTSGNLSPILQKGIGLAYVPPAYSTEGASFAVDIRGKVVPAVVIKPPFYKKKG